MAQEHTAGCQIIFECGKDYRAYRKDLNQEHIALFEVGRYFCTL